VVIINKGKVVAEDTPENLTRRLKGSGALRLEVRGAEADVVAALQTVPGVLAVHPRGGHDGMVILDVEAEGGKDVRAELAWAVVTKGHGLLGLQQLGMSLEEIFLQLTTTDSTEAAPAA
jgi:ABC-2 type transport system ATP-binding protein